MALAICKSRKQEWFMRIRHGSFLPTFSIPSLV